LASNDRKMKPFLILQLRPIDEVSDNEYESFLRYGGLEASETHRVRIEKESLVDIDLKHFSGVILGGGRVTLVTTQLPSLTISAGSRLNLIYFTTNYLRWISLTWEVVTV
jgi:hypothetical protein